MSLLKAVLFSSVFITNISSSATSAETNRKSDVTKPPTQMTKEERNKAADLHEKMASCLRSDRVLADCRQDMMKGCEDSMGKDGCPMGGHWGMMKNDYRGHGMSRHMKTDKLSTGKE